MTDMIERTEFEAGPEPSRRQYRAGEEEFWRVRLGADSWLRDPTWVVGAGNSGVDGPLTLPGDAPYATFDPAALREAIDLGLLTVDALPPEVLDKVLDSDGIPATHAQLSKVLNLFDVGHPEVASG